jgi:regulator of protease activity HflC (stomatin/prohibitin superfamily)
MIENLRPSVPDPRYSFVRRFYFWGACALCTAYFCSGITVIVPGEVGLVRRWGKWVTSAESIIVYRPGLLFAWPAPIDEVRRVAVQQERVLPLQADLQTATSNQSLKDNPPEARQMVMTGDQHLIELQAAVKFRVVDAATYLSAHEAPESALRVIVCGELHSVLKSWSIDEALQTRRSTFAWDPSIAEREGITRRVHAVGPPPQGLISESQLKEFLVMLGANEWTETRLNSLVSAFSYTQSLSDEVLNAARHRVAQLQFGVELTAIELRKVQPPQEVHEAFQAVHNARVEQETWREDAIGEATQKQLETETIAQQYIADAKGKFSSRMADADHEITAFLAASNACRSLGTDNVKARLNRTAWQSILSRAERVYLVPASGSPLRFSIQDSGGER